VTGPTGVIDRLDSEGRVFADTPAAIAFGRGDLHSAGMLAAVG
jgi:hypothetical protein